jgi:aminoglycoside 3-N-acetyltransferase
MSANHPTGAFGYRNILLALRRIGVDGDARVLAIGPSAEPEILRGGVSALTAALADSCRTVITPAFTYQSMVYPPDGPADNAVDYPAASAASVEADFFRASLPVSPLMGPLAESIRRSGGAARSSHPILSFAGWNAQDILETQTLEDPFAPIDELARAGGDVLLLGAEPSANVALHLAEQRAGRKQFVRWALTPKGIVECPVFPGCARGFGAIESMLGGVERSEKIGPFFLQRIPLRDLLNIAVGWIRQDPRALLCENPGCPFCESVRKFQGTV